VLINLLPDFLSVLEAANREAAYRQYREAHRLILDAYWRNYVLDPEAPRGGWTDRYLPHGGIGRG